MFYEKKSMQEGLTTTQSPYTLEEIPNSNLPEDDDNDIDKRLDETDFINPLEEGIEWIEMFRVQNILSKINAPGASYTQTQSETNYETYNYESPAEQQIPYLLKVLNQNEDDEKTKPSPLELKLPRKEDEEKMLVLKTPEPEEEHHEEDQEERRAA
jgi:hypothetical protein